MRKMPQDVPLNNVQWVSCNASPIQDVPGLMAYNQHVQFDFVQDIIAGRAKADPSMLALRDLHYFLAGQLHQFHRPTN